MSNSIISIKKLITRSDKYMKGTVLTTSGDRALVRLTSGVETEVWGPASVGDFVLIRNGQILGVMNSQTEKKVHI